MTDRAADAAARMLYHGARAPLNVGDLIQPGGSAAGEAVAYLTSDLDAAIWGAELAPGDAPPRVYIVEAAGLVEHAGRPAEVA